MSRFWVSPAAAADLHAIVVFIAQDSMDAADAWIEGMYERFAYLAANPGVGTPRDELRPGLRSLPVGNYLVLYSRARSGITVVRVVHGMRDIPAIFRSP